MTQGKQNKRFVLFGTVFLGLIALWTIFRKKKTISTTANDTKRKPEEPISATAEAMAKSQIEAAFQLTKFEKYTDWAFAIAQFETANFTSRIFKENRNAFGMTVPKVRPFLGSSSDIFHEGLAVAKYSSTYQSAKDFIEYLKYFNYPTNINTIEEFVKTMKAKGYFSDSLDNYLKGVKKYLTPTKSVSMKPLVSLSDKASDFQYLKSGAVSSANRALSLPKQNLTLGVQQLDEKCNEC